MFMHHLSAGHFLTEPESVLTRAFDQCILFRGDLTLMQWTFSESFLQALLSFNMFQDLSQEDDYEELFLRCSESFDEDF